MRFSKYNIVSENKGKKIIVNLRTSKWVRISSDDVLERIDYLNKTNDFSLENPVDKAFFDRGFIINDDHNEYEELKDWWQKETEKSSRYLYIMLYVTDQCNFRCIYCPEKHISNRFSQDNWDGLYNYINKALVNNEIDNVSICFFGGEPLLETKKILEFLSKLEPLRQEYKNVKFKHKIVTNGYMLTPELYKKFNDFGIIGYQITVDGFKETHDHSRPRVDGKGTWDKIIQNLKGIAETNDDRAAVCIRTNNNDALAKTLEDFYKWITKEFPAKNFIFDIEGVANFSGDIDEELLAKDDTETRKRDNTIRKQYKDRMLKEQFNVLSKGCSSCRTSNERMFSIFSNGDISKCEAIHMGEGSVVGKLQKDGSIEYNCDIEKWYTNMEYEECEDCIQYPLCGARACPYKRMI